MRTIRLFVDQPLAAETEATVVGQAAEHALRVLRLTVGSAVTLFNGDGHDYPAQLVAASRREMTARIAAAVTPDNESPLQLTLAQGIARGDKMDLIVQKATELGVTRIVPLLTERSEVRLDPARAEKRMAHWQAVAISACEQSGRARVPAIAPIQSLADWIDTLPDDPTVRLALLPQATARIGQLQFAAAGGLLVVGPEGGLGEQDLRVLQAGRFAGLRLGPRILRTETAGLAAIAALQTQHGDL